MKDGGVSTVARGDDCGATQEIRMPSSSQLVKHANSAGTTPLCKRHNAVHTALRL